MTKAKIVDCSTFNMEAKVELRFQTPSGKEKKLVRVIRVVPEGNTYRGEVLLKGEVTGKFIWDTGRFARPVFLSNVIRMSSGQPRRFVNSPICDAIMTAVEALDKKAEDEMAEIDLGIAI